MGIVILVCHSQCNLLVPQLSSLSHPAPFQQCCIACWKRWTTHPTRSSLYRPDHTNRVCSPLASATSMPDPVKDPFLQRLDWCQVCFLPNRGGDIPRYCPVALYAEFLLTSKTIPLMATNVGRLGSVPVAQSQPVSHSVKKEKKVGPSHERRQTYRRIWTAPRYWWDRTWEDPAWRAPWERSAWVLLRVRPFCERECVCECEYVSLCL